MFGAGSRAAPSRRRTVVAIALVAAVINLAADNIVGAEVLAEGVPLVIDADTLELDTVRLRLYRTHAPALGQNCTAAGADWPCGLEAAAALRELIGGRRISCRMLGPDSMSPRSSVCRMGQLVLNRWLVENGWALTSGGEAALLRDAEEQAKRARFGIWRDGFQPTDAWVQRAGLEVDIDTRACSACELRHQALAERIKSRRAASAEVSE